VRIAALDLGTNSFHLLVVDAHPDGPDIDKVAPQVIFKEEST